jgi:hypothetical protein
MQKKIAIIKLLIIFNNIKGKSMKNLKKIALATIAILSFGVNAASHISDHYVGVGIAKTNLEKDTLEYNEVNLKLMLGMMVNDSLAAELQFINLDKGEIYNSGGNSGDFEGKSIGIAGVYYMDDVLPIIPFIKLGIHKWDADITGNAVVVLALLLAIMKLIYLAD